MDPLHYIVPGDWEKIGEHEYRYISKDLSPIIKPDFPMKYLEYGKKYHIYVIVENYPPDSSSTNVSEIHMVYADKWKAYLFPPTASFIRQTKLYFAGGWYIPGRDIVSSKRVSNREFKEKVNELLDDDSIITLDCEHNDERFQIEKTYCSPLNQTAQRFDAKWIQERQHGHTVITYLGKKPLIKFSLREELMDFIDGL